MNPPTTPSDRLPTLDALRGLALIGILLMNIDTFVRPLNDALAVQVWRDDATGTAHWVLDVFVRGKFWMLFSLLFGMGFALVWSRAVGEPTAATRWARRRGLALVLLGSLHIVWLWNGDVLVVYGLGSLLLAACMAWRPATQLVVGVSLYAGLWLATAALGAALLNDPDGYQAAAAADMAAQAARARAMYAEGTFLAVSWFRLTEYLSLVLPSALLLQVPTTLGVFLVGVWLVRSGRVTAPENHRTFWRVMALGGAVLAAPGLAWSLHYRQDLTAATPLAALGLADALHALAALPMVLCYLALWMLLAREPGARGVVQALAPMGRMALTLYLMQSLVCSLLFFGYGLGWYGQIDRWQQVQVAAVILAGQWVFATLWWRRFSQGPLEALMKRWAGSRTSVATAS